MMEAYPGTIISENTRFRYPHSLTMLPNSIIDDFGYFSTQLMIGSYCHIASHAHISGGPERTVTLGDFCALAARVSIICSSNDYMTGLLGFFDEPDYYSGGDVSFGEMTGCGVGCTILWDNYVPEGTVLAGRCFVRPGENLEPWTIYSPDPNDSYGLAVVGEIGYRKRFRDRILRQREKVENE